MSRTISHQTVQGQPVEGTTYAADQRVRDERWTISPARIIGGVVGLVYAVIGIIATVDAGIDSTMNRPVVHVAGLDMSAAVGVGILVAGLLMLLGASSSGATPLIGAMGVVSLAAGVVGLAATGQWMLNIGAARNVGWFLLIGGIICIAAMFFGTTSVHRREVREGEAV
jgi:hypothetical protein